MTKRYLVSVALFLLVFILSYGQSLPLGLQALEDFERRKQLLADSSQSSSSFMLRPLYRQPDSDKLFEVKLMPVVWRQQYDTDHPEGINDGLMIPARGYQTLFSGGVYARVGILSLQLMPEVVCAANKSFDGLPDKLIDDVWKIYNGVKNSIDIPDRFGDEPYRRVGWGQSSLRLTWKSVSLGLSNENLWWGPGVKASLLMTNNAPGFKHITLNTSKPIKTPIGSFEGQLIAGRLDNSGLMWTDSATLLKHGIKPRQKRSDWRYLNAMTLTWQPRWVPGLSVGAARSFILYSKDINFGNYRSFFPLLEPVYKVQVGGDAADTIPSNQNASVFARWVMPESKMEFYLEYGKEDHNWDFNDLMQEPDYLRAYVVGFRKLFPFFNRKNEYFDLHLEMTEFSKTVHGNYRSYHGAGGWYTHGQHGYTHQGQYLGAGIGTGSNLQSLTMSWVKELKKISLELYRLNHEDNIWATFTRYTPYGNIQTHWIDLGGALAADWDYKKLLFNVKLQTVGTINYMFLYDPIPSNPPSPWDKGLLRWNVHAAASVAYLF